MALACTRRPILTTLLLLAFLAAVPSYAADRVCALLTADEVRQVQGEAFYDAKAGRRDGGAMTVSQCVYLLPTFSDSVSLEVAAAGSNAARSDAALDFWNERIVGADRPPAEGRKSRKRRTERRVVVPQLGDEAYWIRTGPTSALYARTGKRWLRLSLGGSLTEAEKIARGTKLLRIAIERLNAQPMINETVR